MGTFQAQKSKYYEGMVVDSVSGAHYDADTGQTTTAVGEPDLLADMRAVEQRETMQAVIRYAGMLAGIVVVAALLTWVAQPMHLLWLALANLGACMAMPVVGAVPFAEDDAEDLPWGVGILMVLGPAVGALAYAVLCVVRASFSPGLVGIFLTYLAIRIPLDGAAGNGFGHLFEAMMPFQQPPAGTSWATHLASLWVVFAGVVGWYFAAMFRQTDE
ncbi:MAG TPA: hypothetical protein VLH79_05965 [Chthonomonadales bacterium]|nr:hypothetical protein [Chthonomonadales bacterium]